MSISRQLGIPAIRTLVATASLAAALIVGQALASAATPTGLASELCPQDTHWSAPEQACVPNDPTPADSDSIG